MLNSVSFEVVDGNRVMSIKSSADDNFRDKANTFMRYYLRVAITIVPILFIYLSYLVLKKKFTIDEEMYEMMIAAIKKRQVE